MAALSEEGAPSFPFGRWDLVTIVGTQGSREETVRRAGCEEHPFRNHLPRAIGPIELYSQWQPSKTHTQNLCLTCTVTPLGPTAKAASPLYCPPSSEPRPLQFLLANSTVHISWSYETRTSPTTRLLPLTLMIKSGVKSKGLIRDLEPKPPNSRSLKVPQR